MIRYRKTKDDKWVACGPVTEVRPGVITVEKASGEKKQEIVESLGHPFMMDGQLCVYGYLKPKATTPAPMAPQAFGERFKPRNPERVPARRDGRCKEPGCHATAWRDGYCKQCWFDEYDC